jgi:hypothetical protein
VGENSELHQLHRQEFEDAHREENSSHQQSVGRGRRRKKFVINLSSSQKIFLPFWVISLTTLAYIVLIYVLSNNQVYHLSALSFEYRLLSLAEPRISFSVNALRQALLEGFSGGENFTVLNGENIYSYARARPSEIEKLLDEIYDKAQQNVQIKDEGVVDVQNQIFLSNHTCELLVAHASACLGFEDQTIANGLSLALSQMTYNYRNVLNSLVPGNTETRLAEIFSSPIFQQLDQMQVVYNNRLFRILIEEFYNSIQRENDFQYSLQLTLMLICTIIVCSLFLVLHLPILNRVSSEVERIRNMVTMIPIDLIQ